MLTFLLGIIKIKRDIVFAASLYLWEVDMNWLWKPAKNFTWSREKKRCMTTCVTLSYCGSLHKRVLDAVHLGTLDKNASAFFWCCGFDFSVHFGLQIPQDNLRSVLQRTAYLTGPRIYWGVKRHFFDQRMTLNCDTHSSRTFICSLLGYTSWTYDW